LDSKRKNSKQRKLKRSDVITLRLDSHVEGKLFVDIQAMLNENNRTKLKAKSVKGIKSRNRNSKYITALNCLLANLVEAVLQELPLAIGHREDFFKTKKRPNPKAISAYVMTALLKLLRDRNHGLVSLTRRGYFDRKTFKDSMLSLYEPTANFDLFKRMATKGQNQLFIRRMDSKNQSRLKAEVYEPGDDNRTIQPADERRPEVVRAIQVLTSLDAVLQKSTFKIRSVSFAGPMFYRSFSPDYARHGRIYSEGGSFQNWKKQFIKDLLIDECPTVELDYSSTHSAIAYAIKGASMPRKDVYLLDTLAPIQDDKTRRSLGKVFTNILLNAKSRKTAIQAIGKAFADQGIRYKTDFAISIPDVIAEITKRHRPIQESFLSGAGLRLMKIESDICLEVIDQFTQLNKPIIPKHDSFIVKAEDEELLCQTMQRAWIHVISRVQDGNGEVQVPNISKK
jgi:hypothetical protein